MKSENDLSLLATPEYRRFIKELKARVVSARISAARSVNRDGILLYWDIGRAIVEKQQVLGWGESVIDRVSCDLRAAFPNTTGFSPRNLRDMRRLYLAYADEAIWRQLVAKLPVEPKGGDAEIRRQPVANLGLPKESGAIWPHPAAKLTDTTGRVFLHQLVAEIPWG
ncbi:MAG: DUF1016 N-terminal domain-containing protein, partial [Verrucomicrobia bacterium]|nr:DUF1016 N-terminal domain-containing protein [Verrucomicrobiota bacterium]